MHDAINAPEINRWVFMVGGRETGVEPGTLSRGLCSLPVGCSFAYAVAGEPFVQEN
jgi:hypothetical protein